MSISPKGEPSVIESGVQGSLVGKWEPNHVHLCCEGAQTAWAFGFRAP